MDEKWGDPFKMNPILVKTLDKLRDKVGKPIKIHCGYESRDANSQHSLGNAVDCHCEGIKLVDFFLFEKLLAVGQSILNRVPVVGSISKQLLLGGEVYNDRTLSRFFVLHAAVLPVNGLTGQGAFELGTLLYDEKENVETVKGKQLRFPMPSALCSYCLGETRIGEEYQMGNVRKINLE